MHLSNTSGRSTLGVRPFFYIPSFLHSSISLNCVKFHFPKKAYKAFASRILQKDYLFDSQD